VRRPEHTDLQFAMLLFMVVAPMAYFTLRGLIALAGG
jgi:hypothetical protein